MISGVRRTGGRPRDIHVRCGKWIGHKDAHRWRKMGSSLRIWVGSSLRPPTAVHGLAVCGFAASMGLFSLQHGLWVRHGISWCAWSVLFEYRKVLTANVHLSMSKITLISIGNTALQKKKIVLRFHVFRMEMCACVPTVCVSWCDTCSNVRSVVCTRTLFNLSAP